MIQRLLILNFTLMKKIFLLAILLLMSFLDVNAQQSPHYTQYMYNMNIINPAYAGSKQNLSFGLLYRKQWIQIEDAPSTFSFSGSSPVGKNVGKKLMGELEFITNIVILQEDHLKKIQK